MKTGFLSGCVDAGGQVLRDSNPDYAFVWIGLMAAGSVILSGLLAIALAAPLAQWLAAFSGRNKLKTVKP